MARDYIEALRRHSLELQDLEGDHAQEFLKMLKQLQGELRERMLGTGDPSQEFNSFAVLRAEREAQVAIQTLEDKMLGKFKLSQRDALDLSIEHLGDELDSLSRAFDGSIADVSLSAAKALADPAQKLLANHFESSVSRYGDELLNGVRQRLLVAVRVGDPLRDVVSQVAGERGPIGVVGRDSAERLVRTEISQAYGAAQHNGIAQAARQVPALNKVWLHVGSYRCPVCGPLHGTERPLNGTWTVKIGKKTREVAHPPVHPNDTCRISAMKPSWRRKLQEMGYLEKQTEDEAPRL